MFNGMFRELMKQSLGDSVREPFLMDLGNPFTGAVEISLEDGAEMPGLVWVHARTSQTMVLSDQPQLDTGDKVSPSRALLKPNKIPDDLKVYGVAVYVVEQNGVLEVVDLGGLAAVEYLFGLKARPQRSIDISQLDYGLLRPTLPNSGRVLTSPFRPTLNATAYDVPALMSIDLIDTYAGTLTDGYARAVMVECDPTDATLHYTASSPFLNTTHVRAFPLYYPKTVNRGRFLMGYVKLYFDIVGINITDIYASQEIYSKDTLAGEAVLDAIVVAAGGVVTSQGGVVRVSS